jgi:hypothetical protein
MKKTICVFLFALIAQTGFSKFLSDSSFTSKKGSFYLLWGYNRDAYTKSTIHFQNDGDPTRVDEFGVYDFTLYNVVAHDRPNFEAIHDVINFTIPQFNFRIGYYFNNKKDWGIEFNYDHPKYVVTDYQTAHIEGTILGHYVNKDTLMDPHFIHFEHSDGANFIMLMVMKRWKLQTKNGKHNIGFVIKPGIGVVYPRTDVTIFGEQLNNNWKIAGVIGGVEGTIRGELYKHFVVEFATKAAEAEYINCLVHGKGNGKATHHFGTIECVLSVGYQFDWGHMGHRCKFIW